MRFSPCLEIFWPEYSLAERITRAASFGFSAYEFWGYWNKDLPAVERAAREAGMTLAACCLKSSFLGPFPSILAPGGEESFVDALREALPLVARLDCRAFIVTTGDTLPGVPRQAQFEACVAALKAAAPLAEDAGVCLVVEPLNVLFDHPGCFLSRSDEAFALLDAVGSPAVKLLYDVYHQQITEGNLTPTVCTHIEQIGHFHVADYPGRHEPGTGEINYSFLLRRIHDAGYDAHVGLEFAPSDPVRTDEILRNLLTEFGL